LVVGEVRIIGINPSDYKETYDVLESWAQAHWPAAAQEVDWPGSVFLFSTMTHASLIIFTIDKLAPISTRFSKTHILGLRFTIPLTSQQHQEKLRVKKLRK
jgi:hypothetical protein